MPAIAAKAGYGPVALRYNLTPEIFSPQTHAVTMRHAR